jgi:hypothetical protein|nr:MAG TPA: mannose-6-phosphate receptor [Caudoviricetes sp.]
MNSDILILTIIVCYFVSGIISKFMYYKSREKEVIERYGFTFYIYINSIKLLIRIIIGITLMAILLKLTFYTYYEK